MPFKSDAQRKLVYFEASKGTAWARKFLKDMGITDLPPVKRKHRKVRRSD